MKVLASVSDRKYICEVSHEELEKFLNEYYGKMKTLTEGTNIDLGRGYDFLRDTASALKKTEEFINSNGEIIKSITDGIVFLGSGKVEDNG